MTFFKQHARNIFGTEIILLIVFSVFLPAAWAETTQGQTTPAKVVAAIHCDYVPVSFWDKKTNKPAGFFVDIMDAIAPNSGLQVQYICRNGWPEIISAIESSEADLGALLKSKEREKELLFSAPIDMTYLSFFTRSQSSADAYKVPAAGYTVGVVKGSMSYEQLKNRPGLRLQAENSYEEGIFKLLAGEADLFAGEDTSIMKAARGAGLDDRIKKVGKPFVERERGVAVQKNNVRLLELLNKSLAGFIGSPEYQRIYIKWYGAPAPYWTIYRILSAGGILLFIVVCGMVFWRYKSITRINAALKLQITERRQAEDALLRAHDELEKRVTERTSELARSNRELLKEIAERKRTEESLLASEARYRSYIDVPGQIGWVTNVDGEVVEDVPSLRKFSGQTYEEAKGSGWAKALHPDDLERTLRGWNKAVSTKSPYEVEYRMRRHDGDYRHLLARGFPVFREDKSIREWVGTCIDITERKQVELELQKTHAQLLHVEKLAAIGGLSASIAHEFNNPLQGVMTVIKGVKRRATMDEEDSQLVDSAINECNRMRDLINNLQDFNRPSSGRMAFMNIHATIDSLLMLSKKEYKTKGVTVETNYAEDMPQIKAIADQIKQVLLNLLINAAYACKGGDIITISTDVVSKENITVKIQDTGKGIKPEHINHIFDPFFSTKPDVTGVGLGLSISYGIVKMHGGRIDVESEPEKGTTFTITLPIAGVNNI